MIVDRSMVNAFVPGAAVLSEHENALVSRRQRVLGPAYRLFYERPVHLVRGQGVWLYDEAGQAYLDVYNNVASLGHCHPKVVEAISRQAGLLATHTRYLHEDILAYAERLLATLPDSIGQMMFTCTGSEANDLALRIARGVTGGEGVIVTACAYHGVTGTVAAISPSLGEHVPLARTTRTVAAPDAYRTGEADVGAAFEADVRRAIADMRRHGIRPAALIADSVFSSDGIYPHPAGVLQGAAAAIREAGGLFIADEVQSGFGRTGENMWGFARHGVLPDLVTFGKPMGNGYPVAGLAANPQTLREFGERSRYFNTFGGNAVGIAAATAVLDVIEEEGLLENAHKTGAYFRERLEALAASCEAIGDVRQVGLFIGVEIVKDRTGREPDAALTTTIVNGLRERGVLISATGPRANVLKIRPPLNFETAHVDFFMERMSEVLSLQKT